MYILREIGEKVERKWGNLQSKAKNSKIVVND